MWDPDRVKGIRTTASTYTEVFPYQLLTPRKVDARDETALHFPSLVWEPFSLNQFRVRASKCYT